MAASSPGRVTVAHVITQLELGGAQQNTLHTVRSIDRARFAPVLIAGPGGVLTPAARAIPGLAFFELPTLARRPSPRRDLAALVALRACLRQLPRPLLVHTHSSKAGVLGRLAARAVRAEAVVHTVHGYAFHPYQPTLTRRAIVAVERALAPCADAYVCVSRADLETGEGLGLFGQARVELIRSGIDVDAFHFSEAGRRQVRRALGIADEAEVVGTVANFKPQKAPLDFVAAARAVLAQRPRAHFVYVGDGPLRPEVERALDGLPGRERVHLVGWRADVEDFFSAFDVFLLTSRHEGFPRSVLQALAAGCRVVATRTGGTDELAGVIDLVDPGDVDAMQRRVLAALAAVGHGRPPPPPVLEEFSAARMVAQLEALYAQIID